MKPKQQIKFEKSKPTKFKIGTYVDIVATTQQLNDVGMDNKTMIKQLKKHGGVITGISHKAKFGNYDGTSWIVNKIFTFPELFLEPRNLKINTETGETIKEKKEIAQPTEIEFHGKTELSEKEKTTIEFNEQNDGQQNDSESEGNND